MFRLVVDALEIGRGRVLVVEAEVLDLGLEPFGAIWKQRASGCRSKGPKQYSVWESTEAQMGERRNPDVSDHNRSCTEIKFVILTNS